MTLKVRRTFVVVSCSTLATWGKSRVHTAQKYEYNNYNFRPLAPLCVLYGAQLLRHIFFSALLSPIDFIYVSNNIYHVHTCSLHRQYTKLLKQGLAI